jgi:hypothetical protein
MITLVVGVVAVVKSWNQEVENCMKFQAEHGQVEAKISEFKRVIRSLQSIITEKELEVMQLTNKNNLLEEASQWFDKWSHTKAYLRQEQIHHERICHYQNLIQMAQEDQYSTKWNVLDQMKHQFQQYQAMHDELRQELGQIQLEREVETKTRIKLNYDMQLLYTDKQLLKIEVDQLNINQVQSQAIIQECQARIDHVTKLNATLTWSLTLKEAQYEEYKIKATAENSSLATQVQQLTDDYNEKEEEVDRLRDDARSRTVSDVWS